MRGWGGGGGGGGGTESDLEEIAFEGVDNIDNSYP